MLTEQVLPHYLTVEDDLQTLNIPLTAAEAHGLITGVLCATGDDASVISTIFGSSDELPANDPLIDDAKQEIRNLCITTASQLADENFGFQLLLPTDENNLTTRSCCVGLWCQGFISGLGEGRIAQHLENQADSQELIQDLSEIAKIDSEAVDNDEQQEINFMELVEFVRIAALTIHADLRLKNNIATEHASATLH